MADKFSDVLKEEIDKIKLNELLQNCYISKLNVNKNDTIIVKVNTDKISQENAMKIFNMVKNEFKYNKVISMPYGCDLTVVKE